MQLASGDWKERDPFNFCSVWIEAGKGDVYLLGPHRGSLSDGEFRHVRWSSECSEWIAPSVVEELLRTCWSPVKRERWWIGRRRWVVVDQKGECRKFLWQVMCRTKRLRLSFQVCASAGASVLK
jgi:hypothetical protein